MNTHHPTPWTYPHLVDARAESNPDRTFVRSHDQDITYGEFRERVSALAGGIADLGVERGDVIATMLDSDLRHVVTWFACSWLGAIEVPINTEFRGTYLEHVLNTSAAESLIIQKRFLPRLQGLSLPHLRRVVVCSDDDAADPSDMPWDLVPFVDIQGGKPLAFSDPQERDLTMILFTSGTTGPSKGVMQCHRSALWTGRVWNDMYRLTHEDVGYSFLPLFHVTARSMMVAGALIAGASVALRPTFSVSEFWDDVDRFGATYFGYMGAVIQMLWNDHRRHHADVTQVDTTLRIGGGAAAPPDIVDDFEHTFGLTLLEVYGMTEIGTASGSTADTVKRGTMGKPFDHLEIQIQDENGFALPADTAGEIVVRPREPYAIMQGYWRAPEATVEAWRQLWFHTGDRGKLTGEGDLIYLDRIKDSLRRRGENISSFELERTLMRRDDVEECAVYGVPSELTEDEVMAAVVVPEGTDVDVMEFFEYCAREIPRYAVPRYLRFVAELPKTPTARVEKYKLREEAVTSDTHDREKLGIRLARE